MQDPPAHANATCSHCGNHLNKLNLNHCPECSHAITVECFWCQYDLTHAPHDHNCPECGFPVSYSTGQGPFKSLPTQTLNHQINGLKWAAFATLLYPISFIATGIFWVAVTLGIGFGDPQGPGFIVPTIFAALTIFELTLCIKWWQITTPTDFPEKLEPVIRRRLLRLVLVLCFVGFVARILLYPIYTYEYQYEHDGWRIFLGVIAFKFFTPIILFITQFFYLNWFAMMLNNRWLYRYTKRTLVIYSITIASIAPLTFVFGFIVTLVIMGVFSLIFMVMFIMQTEEIRKGLIRIRDARPT